MTTGPIGGHNIVTELYSHHTNHPFASERVSVSFRGAWRRHFEASLCSFTSPQYFPDLKFDKKLETDHFLLAPASQRLCFNSQITIFTLLR